MRDAVGTKRRSGKMSEPGGSAQAAAAQAPAVAPQDLEAERLVLGAMIIDPETIPEVREVVEARDFYRPEHQTLFEAICRMDDAREPIDGVSVRARLESDGLLDRAGGTAYLMEILAATPSAAFAAKHARIVREKAVLRALVRVGQSILREAAEGPGDTDDLIGRIEHMLFEVAQHGQQRRARPVHEFLEETYRYIYEYQNRRLLGLSTGIYELNEVLNGLQPGYFYVVAGRPSMGKTSLALRLLEEVTMGPDPVPALFVSLEMPGEVIARILLCSRCHVSVHKLHQGMISKEEQKRLLEHSHLLDRAPLLLDDSPDLTIHELRARARRLRSDPKHPIRLVVVDYLQLLRAPEAESRQLEISEISRGLKAMAKDMNIPVVALAQLNRQPEGREGHKPRLADLRESGSIEQDADVVMLLYREEYYNPDTERKNIADIIIAKNRTGPTGEVQAVFHAPLMRFEPLARVAQEAVATAAVPPRGGSVPDEESAF